MFPILAYFLQAAAPMDTLSRQAFPPLHMSGHRHIPHQQQQMLHPSQLTTARQQSTGAVPRFPGRLMNSTHTYPSGLNPYAAQPPNLYPLNQTATQFAPRVSAYGAGAKLGPGDANAGPRMFVGKLNKETSEQDIKVCSYCNSVLNNFIQKDICVPAFYKSDLANLNLWHSWLEP